MRPATLTLALALCCGPGWAGERDFADLQGTYFLDGDRVLIRLTLNRDRSCELLGPDGQRTTAGYRVDGQELLIAAGTTRRSFTFQIQDGDLLLTPTSRDHAEGADLLGGLLPAQRGDERRYVSLKNWRAKGRPVDVPGARAAPATEPGPAAPVGEATVDPSALRRLAAEVPMKIVDERILLPVRLNDQFDSHAVLDTGACHCLLDLSQLDLKKPKLENERKMLFPYIGQVTAQDLVLDSLAVGPYRLTGFRIAAVKRNAPLSRDAPILLGMEFLKEQPFTLDFARRRFVLWMPGSILPPPAEGLKRVKLELVPDPVPNGGRPHVQVPVNGATQVRFLVDTGAPLPFFLRALDPAGQGFSERWAVTRMPTFLGRSFQHLPVLQTTYKRIELGSWVLENETGYLLDLSAQQKRVYGGDLDALLNLIGTPFLRMLHAVHFDLPNRVMYLDKPE